MGLPIYLAMTAQEIAVCGAFPAHPAYMACHFSAYGSGLEDIPEVPSPGWLLVLDDRVPVWGHEPEIIAQQLQEAVVQNDACGVLLDFQRPDCPQTQAIASSVVKALQCPVCVSSSYAQVLDCPVLLPPLLPNRDLQAQLAPWEGREIWLELALDALQYTVTADGSRPASLPRFSPRGKCHRDDRFCCRYEIQTEDTQAVFTLFRTPEDWQQLLEQTSGLGVRCGIGLYQEFQGIA